MLAQSVFTIGLFFFIRILFTASSIRNQYNHSLIFKIEQRKKKTNEKDRQNELKSGLCLPG